MYTKQDRREAESYAETLIDEAIGHGVEAPQEIKKWLTEYKSYAITQYMRDMTEWQQITINNLTCDDIDMADFGSVDGVGDRNIFPAIVDRILLKEFMVNLTDIDHEIDAYLAGQSEDDRAEHEAADHQQRVGDYRAEVRS